MLKLLFGNKTNFSVLTVLLIFFCYSVKSQSNLNFTQFYLQDYYYNPSFFGSDDGNLKLNITHRQWSNSSFSIGPNIQNFGINKRISFKNKKTKLGFGGQFFSNNQGQAFQSSSYGGGVSLSFKTSHKSYLALGLAGYYNQNTFNPSNFENMESGDIVLESGQLNDISINPSFGLNYSFDNNDNFSIQFGAAFTNMYDFKNKPELISPTKSLLNEYNGILKLRFGSSNNFNIHWFSVYKGNGGFESNYNGWPNTLSPNTLSSIILFNIPEKNIFSFGVGYNTCFSENNKFLSSSISPIIKVGLGKFKIGLAYDFGLTSFQQYNNGIIELSLIASFGNNEEDKVEEKENKKKKKKKTIDKSKNYLNNLMQNTNIYFKSLDGEEIKIKSEINNGNLNVINNSENEDYLDFTDFFIGDLESGYFKLKINSNSEKDLFYEVKILDFEAASDGSNTITNSALLKQIRFSDKGYLKYRLPEKFIKTDFYFISIYCLKETNNKIYKSSSLKIKFKLNND